MEVEVKNLIEIIIRKIYHENIIFCSNRVLEGKSIKNKIILLESINLENISEDYLDQYGVVRIKELESAIMNGEDLNRFGMVNGEKCIESDLNFFLEKVKFCRKQSLDSWIEMLKFTNIDKDLINWVTVFLSTHTEVENMLMKQAFLEKVKLELNIKITGEDYEQEFYDAVNFILDSEHPSLS